MIWVVTEEVIVDVWAAGLPGPVAHTQCLPDIILGQVAVQQAEICRAHSHQRCFVHHHTYLPQHWKRVSQMRDPAQGCQMFPTVAEWPDARLPDVIHIEAF
jgi:hypothetical protein